MSFRHWFTRRRETPLDLWRARWATAAAASDRAEAARLREELEATPPLAEDLEIEQEMMDGLERVLALDDDLTAGRFPRIETSHRVVAADACHFSVPASLPDDPAQAAGRVLFTSSRAVFVGGARLAAVPWHAVKEAVRADRDLLLVRTAEDALRLRFNTYGDALCAAALARRLKRPSRPAPGSI
jgi:hypothetical protein